MKKRKRLLVILSTFVMAAQPLCVAAEMQDAEGFGAVEEIWADEENEESEQKTLKKVKKVLDKEKSF